MKAKLEVYPGPDAFARAGAHRLAKLIGEAVTERDHCALAVSRPTPAEVFATLAAADVPWGRVDLFQVDERAAPEESEDRNLTLLERDLLSRIPGERPRVHPMPVLERDLDRGAEAYAAELVETCGRPPVLDVVHLGLGPDGHTASLLPGDPVLAVADRWVAPTRASAGFRRLTLTYPVLDLARSVVFLVAGEAKSKALEGILGGDPSLPAAHLSPAEAVVLADSSAAAGYASAKK